MRLLSALLCLAAVSAPAAAQELKPTPWDPSDVLVQGGYVQVGELGKPEKGDVTVNPKAVVATATAGTLVFRVAVDSEKADAAAPDVVRIDWAGSGEFTKGDSLLMKEAGTGGEGENKSTHWNIAAKNFDVKVGDRTVPVTIMGSYSRSKAYRSLGLMIGTCLEAKCKFGDKAYIVRLIDSSGDLECTQAAKPPRRLGEHVSGDTLAIYEDGKDGKRIFQGFYGQPVQIDSKWYTVTAAKDQKTVAVEPATFKTGKIKVDWPRWDCMLTGKKYIVPVKGEAGEVEVPVDDYVVTRYQLFHKAQDPSSQMYFSYYFRGVGDKPKVFSVSEGKTTELVLGKELTAKIEAGRRGEDVYFALKVHDSTGTQLQNYSPAEGKMPKATVTVLDADGKEVYKNTLEAG